MNPTLYALLPANGILTENLVAEYHFDEGAGNVVLNRAVATHTYENQLLFPERRLSLWKGGKSNITVTDDYTTDPNGNLSASRLVSVGGSIAYLLQAVPLTAGEWTISCYVKSNTGNPQAVRFTLDNTGTLSTDKVVPTTWTQVSYTTTIGAGTNGRGIVSDSADSALDISICGLKLESGSNATPRTPEIFDLTTQSAVAWNSDGIDVDGGIKFLAGVSSEDVVLNQATVYAVLRLTGTEAAYEPILNPVYNPRDILLAANEVGKGPCFSFRNSSAQSRVSGIGDGRWYALTGVYDGARVALYVGKAKIAEVAASGLTPVTLRDLIVATCGEGTGAGIGGIGNIPGTLAYLSLYNTGHTDAQIKSNLNEITTLLSFRGLMLPSVESFIAFEGDSLSELNVGGSGNFPLQAMRASSPRLQGKVFAVSGSGINNMNDRAAEVDSYFDVERPFNVLHVLIGRNDLMNSNAADYVASLKTYCLARRAAGWNKIVLGTVLPATAPGFNAARNAVNTLIRADDSFYDVLADFAADATMGPDAAASNTTLYYDGTHPSETGHSYLAPIALSAINSVLV